MTKEEALEKAKEIKLKYNGDTEMIHVFLDELLCDVLKENGYDELVKEYENTYMWHA